MAFRNGARPARLVLAMALAAGQLLALPVSIRALGGVSDDDGISSSGDIQGSICAIEASDCPAFEHSSPEGVRTFAATDERSGGNDRVKANLRYDETYGPDNTIRSITVSGRLEAGNSGGGRVDATADYSLNIDDTTTTITVSGNASGSLTGSEFIVSDADFSFQMECGGEEYEVEAIDDAGASEPSTGAIQASVSRTFEIENDECSLDLSAFIDASTNRPAPGESGSADLSFSLTITFGEQPQEGCNGVSGTVFDGVAGSPHHNPLRGIRVELRRDGSRVGNPSATGETGRYCVQSFAGVVDPGDYQLRATLIDATHEPPLFETRYRDEAEATWIETPVTIEDFNPDVTTDLEFAVRDIQPWLPDVANIHWQSERFARWLTATQGLDPTTLGSFIVEAFSTRGTSYSRDARTARVNSDGTPSDDSRYSDRDQAGDEGPENNEWHEIGHHVAHSLAIAPTNTAPACDDRIPHGGWINETTCDSLAEGFAVYITTAASVDIDAGRGEGYGDAVYSVFGSQELNTLRPWSSVNGTGNVTVYREDFAVSQLLWDLADDTPDERGDIEFLDPADQGVWTYSGNDRVALGATNLITIMAGIRPTTIDELYRGLLDHPAVPSELKTLDVNLLGEEPAELGPLMEVFLMHGFHPVEHEGDPRHVVGNVVARTDHAQGGGGVLPRPHIERVPGANILLRNPTAAPVRYEIRLEEPEGSTTRVVTVAAGSEELVYVEPPAYWRGAAPATGQPACGAEGQRATSVRISAPRTASRTIEGCEYSQAVIAAQGAAALTYEAEAGGSGPAGSDAPPSTSGPGNDPGSDVPVAIVLGGVILIIVLIVAAVLVQRRSASSGAGT
jgi:hypothetical protein